MKYQKSLIWICLFMVITVAVSFAATATRTIPDKKMDVTRFHNVGNIWLRVSNYGFFGSGNDAVPQWPSLEYPGGSGIDYLYQGALWFGAKKYRRNSAGRKLYWVATNPSADSSQVVAEGDPTWNPRLKPVIDTLVTIGFDGDMGLYELLPAYNPLESSSSAQDLYEMYNLFDQSILASTRYQKRGVDDDGDGIIDEDFVGYTFPMRQANELPTQFRPFGGQFLANTNNYAIVSDPKNLEIWFPLGFMELSDRTNTAYNFTKPNDDDGDGQIDEDGAPVSEQDFIGYYYDYSPFGTSGDRDYGRDRGRNTHVPLNIRVRQMSYQWSYEYIKNLCYVEFDITNMNIAYQDTLFDCTMGIYMDSDVGPQSYGAERASDDVSGYVMGTGYEFAYTRDYDGDNGLTTGLVGSRVCTPDPEQLRFSCWYWKVGDGPNDHYPQSWNFSPRRTANEKYWLLTGRNPNDTKYLQLRGGPSGDAVHFEQPSANDTRYLFAFYGAQPNTADYSDPAKRWDLAPGKTMKIVIAVFPGDNLEDLKRTARWAKEIYGTAQTLTTVVLPDTFPHYNPPEPPDIPKLYAELVDDGNKIDLYWDNRSEFSYDTKTVSTAVIGWRDPNNSAYIPGLDSDPLNQNLEPPLTEYPPEFLPGATPYNNNATVNPFTGYRLRHDFQGYSLWVRSGSGSQEDWELVERWDKKETPVDLADYQVNNHDPVLFVDYGGYQGIDKGLPNEDVFTDPVQKVKFYRYNEYYRYVPVQASDKFYGWPLYNPDIDWSPALQAQADAMAVNPNYPTAEEKKLQARLFKYPGLRDEIYDELVDTKVIPLRGHGGQVAIPDASGNTDALEALKKARLARRYYKYSQPSPPKGVEYYVAVTAFDRGMPANDLFSLESGRDADANMKVFFPGPLAKENMDNIYVVPNPYLGSSKFDGRRDLDSKGDKSKRLWFVNLPEKCNVRIYTLAGDLVDEFEHNGAYQEDIINRNKASYLGLTSSGIHAWDLLSKHNQIIASGVYLFSVENKRNGKIKVGKFVVIK